MLPLYLILCLAVMSASAQEDNIVESQCTRTLPRLHEYLCEIEASKRDPEEARNRWPWVDQYVYPDHPPRTALMTERCCKETCNLKQILSYC